MIQILQLEISCEQESLSTDKFNIISFRLCQTRGFLLEYTFNEMETEDTISVSINKNIMKIIYDMIIIV
jgi:hypothetical protein